MRGRSLAEREREWRRLYPEAFGRHDRRASKKSAKIKKVRKSRHHLRNKCHGGKDCNENILILTVDKHREWHRIFRNSDPEYIIRVLQRMMRMKGYDYEECGSEQPQRRRK